MTKAPTRPAARRRASLAVLCALLACAAAGCGNLIPGAGPVTTYTNQASSNSNNDVRVWPAEPTKGEKPGQIVTGFLLSSASGPADVDIAEDYLTGPAKSSWNGGKIYVYTNGANLAQAGPDEVQVPLNVIATVSTEGEYEAAPVPSSETFDFKLADTPNGYRIAELPPDFGMAMDLEQFRSNYAPYSVFYDSPFGSTSQHSMVPVQFYVPSGDSDQATADQLADDLLGSLPGWVSGVAQVAAEAESDTQPQVSIDQDGVAQVVLGGTADCAAGGCQRLADELRASFAGIGSVTIVKVLSKKGSVLAASHPITAIEDEYGIKLPGPASRGGSPTVYFLDPSGRVERGNPPQGGPFQPVAVPLAPTGVKLGDLAVGTETGAGPTQIQIAAANTAATDLYVAQAGAAPPAGPVFTATDIGSLTWDDFGDLWFIATVGGTQYIYRLGAQQTAPQRVTVVSPAEQPIKQIAVAPDGRRLAVLSGTGSADSASDLSIGVAETFNGVDWTLDLDGALQQLVSGWNSIADVAWTDSRSLSVLGTQTSSSAPTIYQYYSDGSPVVDANLNAETITPPGGANAISWTDGSANLLLAQCSSCTDGQAATSASPDPSDNGGDQQQFIAQYEPTGGTWSELIPGTSPAIAG